MSKFINISKEEIAGIYGVTIKANASVPIDTTYLMPNEDLLDYTRRRYEQSKGKRLELTETSFDDYLEWVKENEPEILLHMGRVVNLEDKQGESI